MALLPLLRLHLFILQYVVVAAHASVSPTPSVIVVGAGISGIAAAKTLHDAGVQDILILEATSRIGGRIKKAEIGGYTVELGANWYQGGGPVPNPILEIAERLNLRSSVSDFDNITSNAYKQRGGLYPKEQVEEAEYFAAARDDFCVEFAGVLDSEPGKDEDVSILAAQRLFGKVPETPLERAIDYLHNDYDDAEPPELSSLKHSFPKSEREDHGETSYFAADPRGFEAVAHYLKEQFISSSPLATDARLQLNKVVRQIIYNDTGVEVVTEDGSIYQSKYIVVSVSVGVLQTDLVQFKPALPMWKQIAIDDFSMTVYTKIFLKFPYKFWPTGPGTEFFLYSHIQRGYYPVWQHLENEYPGSNILFVTVTHDESRRIEQLPDEAIQAEVVNVLRKMFGEDIPEPESILLPRWWSDRFYKGSYSNWPDNYSQERHSHLGAAVGPVCFTGEHTHSKYLGWVTGAYFAGIKTADDLMKKMVKEHGSKGFLGANDCLLK